MNKQDLAGIRKEFKPENTMLSIKEIYSVYLKKDNQSVIYSEFEYFDSIDSEKQELYIKNFKKILSGALDTKLFELEFKTVDIEDNAQKILYSAVKEEKDIFKEEADKIVSRIGKNYKYETDVVITFIKAEYWKGANKRRSEEAEEAKDDEVYAFEFMMCSVNKIEPPKKALKFDYIEREFRANSALDSTINLDSPLDGFMFPVFNNNSADVNRIMYYASKSKDINISFVEDILNCEFKKTAEEEKGEFMDILRTVVGEKIAPETMQNIYEKLSEKLEEDEEESEASVVSREDLKGVLEESGVENVEKLEEAYERVTGNSDYELKVQNIVPNMNSKSIKITTEDMSLAIAPKELKNIRKVKDSHGNTCLLIELNEDVIIDGFELATEEL
ncbi:MULTISPECIES: DUF4317 family protein [Clostridium]|uniref:DUF4317 family protein n=1 Tax=Clostridium cibarium TaxID=2762247 RepID=A0ABR8PXE0_9CLOT|nr:MULTISPECIES: DUF4317 family protein [Clostridium]MBD7912809.1 DUF4317 family protein [Clostridium cibarium]